VRIAGPCASQHPPGQGILENVYDARAAAGRIVVAQLSGAVSRHSGWKAELTEQELAAAVAELQEITGGRPDGPALMAEVAGVRIGTHAGIPLEEDKAAAEARILVAAGADVSLIDDWARVGAERAAQPRHPPAGGGLFAPGHPARPPARPRARPPEAPFPA